VFEEHVIPRIELDELRAANLRCQQAAFCERRDRVLTRVHDPSRRPHAGEPRAQLLVGASGSRPIPAWMR
jgi:hypothetical protein